MFPTHFPAWHVRLVGRQGVFRSRYPTYSCKFQIVWKNILTVLINIFFTCTGPVRHQKHVLLTWHEYSKTVPWTAPFDVSQPSTRSKSVCGIWLCDGHITWSNGSIRKMMILKSLCKVYSFFSELYFNVLLKFDPKIYHGKCFAPFLCKQVVLLATILRSTYIGISLVHEVALLCIHLCSDI